MTFRDSRRFRVFEFLFFLLGGGVATLWVVGLRRGSRKYLRFVPTTCAGSHKKSDHLISFKGRVFDTLHFCGLYRICTGTETISDFLILGFLKRVHEMFLILVVRIARLASLAIWHRGRSHRRPNRSGSPNRRHFASLDLNKHPDFSHRRPASQDFRRLFFLAFSWDFRSSECVFASLAKKKKKKLFRIASDLGMCDSNRIAHRGCIARFGPLSS